jgi:hypothetical protein
VHVWKSECSPDICSGSDSSVFNLPSGAWSWRWYDSMLHKEGLGAVLGLSLGVAFASTVVAFVLGTLCAIAIKQGRFWGREALLAFLVSPLLMPGLVIGVALLQALRAVGVQDVFVALLIGHIVITLPYGTRTVHASLMLFDMRLIEAAQTLGLSKCGQQIKFYSEISSDAASAGQHFGQGDLAPKNALLSSCGRQPSLPPPLNSSAIHEHWQIKTGPMFAYIKNCAQFIIVCAQFRCNIRG